jgi:phage tail-like protein
VDANGHPIVRKVPGALKWSNITLKRGVDESQDLSNWRKQVLEEGPDSARVDGFIEMLDYDGKPIKRYKFLQGWPIKYTGVSFDPKSSDVAVEELQICHEGLEVE